MEWMDRKDGMDGYKGRMERNRWLEWNRMDGLNDEVNGMFGKDGWVDGIIEMD